MKKVFTLTEKKEIKLARNQKIIPAEEFSTFVSAEEVLNLAKNQALDYRKAVASECELLKTTAEKAGFDAGLAQFNKQLVQLEQELLKQKEELQKNISSLATAAVKKIIGKELKTHPEVIVDIVSTAVKAVTQHKRVTIYVNKADLEEIESHRQQIKELFEHIEQLAIQARDDVQQGGCIIETEAGIINAQLEMQIQALERAFQRITETKNR